MRLVRLAGLHGFAHIDVDQAFPVLRVEILLDFYLGLLTALQESVERPEDRRLPAAVWAIEKQVSPVQLDRRCVPKCLKMLQLNGMDTFHLTPWPP